MNFNDLLCYGKRALQAYVFLFAERKFDAVAAGDVFLRSTAIWEEDYGGAAFGDAEMPFPDVSVVLPFACDEPGGGFVGGLQEAETAVRDWLHDDVPESRSLGVGRDACGGLPEPFADASVGVVIEAVHALGSQASPSSFPMKTR